MSTHTFNLVGTICLWMGIVICIGGLLLFFLASTGFYNNDIGNLKLHDSYHVLPNWRFRLYLLSPLLAGGILIVTGLQITRQGAELDARLKQMFETWKP